MSTLTGSCTSVVGSSQQEQSGAEGSAGSAGSDSLGTEEASSVTPSGVQVDREVECTVDSVSASPLRRLSRPEYERTMEDLFGHVALSPPEIPGDLPVHGFENHHSSLNPSPLLVESYHQAAVDIAEQVVKAGLEPLLPCDPTGNESACGRRFIEDFGRNVFRRPPTEAEVDRYRAAEFDAVSPKLSGEDRRKLEDHAQMVRDLERRLSGVEGLSCQAPAQEFGGTYSGTTIQHAKDFGTLIAAAFACDVTRVATLQVRQLPNDEFDAPPGDVHQDFAHQSDSSDSAADEMNKFNARYAEIFAHLVDQVAQYSDPDGNLLDNTLVVWMSEHGLTREAHTMNEAHVVMVGNAGGRFRTGRYISLPRQTVHPHKDEPTQGVAHSHFLVSLMQAMGLEHSSIGMPTYTTGNGQEFSLEGPLEALT